MDIKLDDLVQPIEPEKPTDFKVALYFFGTRETSIRIFARVSWHLDDLRTNLSKYFEVEELTPNGPLSIKDMRGADPAKVAERIACGILSDGRSVQRKVVYRQGAAVQQATVKNFSESEQFLATINAKGG